MHEMTPRQNATTMIGWYEHTKNVIKRCFGEHIKLVSDDKNDPERHLQQQVHDFVDNLQFKILTCSDEPASKQPCMIETSRKEFVNNGDALQAKSIVRVGKNAEIVAGTRYYFDIKQGIRFEHNKELGAKIVTISIIDGTIRVGDGKISAGSDQSYNQELRFRYDHEEKLVIPPMTKVQAQITTSTTKYEQDYTLEFFISKNYGPISVKYLTRCQQMCKRLKECFCCCCCCYSVSQRWLYPKRLLKDLPNFRMDDEFCYFTIDGTLRWISEDFKVTAVPEAI